jgi:drug/metabolite transporter (DMT)-like permease
MTVIAYRNISLSLGRMLDSTTYIFVAVLGCIFLKEKLTSRQLFGILFICAGIIVFSM